MRVISACLLAFLFLTACDRIYFYTNEVNSRLNFYENEENFIAFGKALDEHRDVHGATNCLNEDCWRIGRNFPFFDDEIDPAINEIFEPHLNGIGLNGYIFFQRYGNGSVALPDYAGGRTGDFNLTITYIYWPKPDSSFASCTDYTPPTEDFYDCFIELEHGWMIHRSGLNQVKLSACSKQVFDCQEEGGIQKSCTPDNCRELIPDW